MADAVVSGANDWQSAAAVDFAGIIVEQTRNDIDALEEVDLLLQDDFESDDDGGEGGVGEGDDDESEGSREGEEGGDDAARRARRS